MTAEDLLLQRQVNQQINGTRFKKPGDVVKWMGAMQAQEYAMAKWAIGLRLPGTTDTDMEHAFNKGHILRTHALRSTWHFVHPSDIRWILALSAARLADVNAHWYKKSGLDATLFKKTHKVLEKKLEGGNFLTRNALKSFFEQSKIEPGDGTRLSYIMIKAELDGLICSGPRHGKQFTYALLEERVKPVPALTREEALAALAERYFSSRGPATLHDYAWWSGLTLKEARQGTDSLSKDFVHKNIQGSVYIYKPANTITNERLATFLMPDYDEYGISYKDRSALSEDGQPNIFDHLLVLDGKIHGTWKREKEGKKIKVITSFFSDISKKKQLQVTEAVKKYAGFIESNEAPGKAKKK